MSYPSAEKIVRKVHSEKKIKTVLTAYSYVATVFSMLVFAYMLFYFTSQSIPLLIGCLITLVVPFLLVSLLRKVVNAPRPYEIYEFFDAPPKNKSGNSFPSRHCFSIFAIGTLCLFVLFPLGLITLVFGLLLCFCRVALGLHFVRDVACGAVIGVISSIIGGFVLI